MTRLTFNIQVVRLAAGCLLGTALAGTVSCGGGGSTTGVTTPTPTPQPSVSLTGTYSGSAFDSSGAGQMTWQLTQPNATSVSGTVLAKTVTGTVTFNGTVSGTLSGTALTFTITVPQGGIPTLANCTLNISGAASGVTTTTIAGTYSGTNSCTGPFSNGQFSLAKQ